MKRKNFSLIITIVLFLSFTSYNYCLSLEKGTHRLLNEYIAKTSINKFHLNLYLLNQFELEDGIERAINGKRIWEWIRDGGQYEDEPAYIRSLNHFHNPIINKGLSTIVGTYESALFWAQRPSGTQWPGGQYSWHDVRQYYFWALTSTNLNSRDTYFAETFRGLGQLMHLVQDMSVPAHTRNDTHIIGYEKWVEKNHMILNFNPIIFEPSLNYHLNHWLRYR